MLKPINAKRKRAPALLHEDEAGLGTDTPPYAGKPLKLGIVQPGRYEPWMIPEEDTESDTPKLPKWTVVHTRSRVKLVGEEEEEEEEDEGEYEDEGDYIEEERQEEEERDAFEGVRVKREDESLESIIQMSLEQERRQTLVPVEEREDDPDAFIMKMKRDLDAQRQLMKTMMMAHKKAREDWAHNPFKLVGQEGRGEAEVLKLLFLVADQALEDERITSEQTEELKAQTPYGEFPTLSKCGHTFGDASAISLACATKFQLFGETVQEQLVVGATYSRLRRIQEKHKRTLAWLFHGQVKDKAKIEWAQSQLLHVILPAAIKEWDTQIHSTKGPFVVENGITLADLAIMDFLYQCSGHVMIDALLVDHLALSDMTEAVKSCPKLLAHLQEREED